MIKLKIISNLAVPVGIAAIILSVAWVILGCPVSIDEAMGRLPPGCELTKSNHGNYKLYEHGREAWTFSSRRSAISYAWYSARRDNKSKDEVWAEPTNIYTVVQSLETATAQEARVAEVMPAMPAGWRSVTSNLGRIRLTKPSGWVVVWTFESELEAVEYAIASEASTAREAVERWPATTNVVVWGTNTITGISGVLVYSVANSERYSECR